MQDYIRTYLESTLKDHGYTFEFIYSTELYPGHLCYFYVVDDNQAVFEIVTGDAFEHVFSFNIANQCYKGYGSGSCAYAAIDQFEALCGDASYAMF